MNKRKNKSKGGQVHEHYGYHRHYRCCGCHRRGCSLPPEEVSECMLSTNERRLYYAYYRYHCHRGRCRSRGRRYRAVCTQEEIMAHGERKNGGYIGIYRLFFLLPFRFKVSRPEGERYEDANSIAVRSVYE